MSILQFPTRGNADSKIAHFNLILDKNMTRQIPLEYLFRVQNFVKENGAITNRQCRDLLNLNYDESIKLFNAMCLLGTLRKTGISSATKYVIGEKPGMDAPSVSDVVGWHRKM